MKLATLTSIPSHKSYGQDYYLWVVEQVSLLQSSQLQDLDLVNLVSELEDIGKREKRSVKNNLVVLLINLLKYQFQSEYQSSSWLTTIIEHRLRLRDNFEDSPSLQSYAANPSVLKRCYEVACDRASHEIGL
ncbi:DUF29 domain-containing protein [Neosynechococcus sphagnicola]|uniref:DUF29 domain-containing protein n=1 Tax=Neosynechococcus sphagnicola TaxID=1501145 RepID=UPI0009DDF39C|nr:DUF29 domain-containing protein [Neosynechococcus sphagnicola]